MWLDRGWSGRRPRVVGIVALATPTVVYRFDRRVDLTSCEFVHALSSALAITMVGGNRMTRLEDGAQCYPEMLAAISGAQRSMALECYIFHPGRTGDAFTDIVINGKNGLLIAPNASARACAARVDMALSDPASRRGFARNALETARRFTEDEQAKKLIRIYERLMAQTPKTTTLVTSSPRHRDRATKSL